MSGLYSNIGYSVARFERQRRSDNTLWVSSGPAFGFRAWLRELIERVFG